MFIKHENTIDRSGEISSIVLTGPLVADTAERVIWL